MESLSWKTKMCILVGGTLLASPIAMTPSYGNLLPYLASYFQANMEHINYYVDPLWVITLFRSSFSLSMLFTSPLEHRFGKFACIAVSAAVMSFSVLSGYFAVKEPLALVMTFGVFHGMAVGVVYPLALKLVLETMGARGGTAVGFCAIGSPLGSMVNIGLAFLVINPMNEVPDVKVGSHVYFSDPSLIDRVPYYFLVQGSLLLCINILGLILMYNGTHGSNLESSAKDSKLSISSSDSKASTFSTSENHKIPSTLPPDNCNCMEKEVMADFEPESQILRTLQKSEENGNYKSTATNEKSISIETCNGNGHIQEAESNAKKELSGPVCGELSPMQIIKTRQFWLLWVCCIGISHSFYIHVTLYKEYGQFYISNDALFAAIAIGGSIVNLIIRPNVGIFCDKFGIQATTFAVCTSSAFFMGLVVLGVCTHWALFAVASTVAFGLVSLQLMVLCLLTSHLFGKTHYASNMGLASTGQLLLIFLEPVLIAAMIEHMGWHFVILSGSLSASVSAVAEIALEVCNRRVSR